MMGETMRDAFGKHLAELGQTRADLVVLDADVSSSTKSSHFAKAFPDRFFNVGVAEANMVDVAAGLATSGFHPVVNAFAIFLSLKATDQIRNVLAYNSLPVVLAAGYGGLSDSFDGASHQSIEDIAIMRAIPGVKVVVPADAAEARAALDYALSCRGPVYVRLSRNDNPALPERAPGLGVDRIRVLKAGADLTIAASGLCVSMALEASSALEAKGISAEVLDVAAIKPLDVGTLSASVRKTGRLLTVEEHSVLGGLGGACAEALAEAFADIPGGGGSGFRLERMGIDDRFTESGPYGKILEKYGLSAAAVAARAEKMAK